ncbi:MAG: hypothetical protein KJ824_12310 [Alphaproteobacteria bacterium]|nr:hypothetical protein [Alphaproteobacteria bacterium]
MRRLLVLACFAAVAAPAAATAQTYGQPYYRAPVTTYGQIYGDARAYAPPITELDGRAYAATGWAATGRSSSYGYGGSYGDPYAYRPPARYGYDRGGRYGYSRGSNRWTRWSSPPGRGYHDVYGYNDDRAPRGADYNRYRGQSDYCCVGAYLYDR